MLEPPYQKCMRSVECSTDLTNIIPQCIELNHLSTRIWFATEHSRAFENLCSSTTIQGNKCRIEAKWKKKVISNLISI